MLRSVGLQSSVKVTVDLLRTLGTTHTPFIAKPLSTSESFGHANKRCLPSIGFLNPSEKNIGHGFQILRSYSTAVIQPKDIEIIVNPEPKIWNKIVDVFQKLGRTTFYESYEHHLKNFGPVDFQFCVALNKATKELLGSVNMCRYESIEGSNELVCVGKYFIVPEQRERGIGQFLYNKITDHPNFVGKNYGGTGVPAMTKKYSERRGFDKYYDSELVFQYRKLSDCKIGNLEVDKKVRIIDIQDVDPTKLIFFDTKVNGNVRRDKFIIDWLKMKSMKASKVALNEDDEVVGYIGLCEIGDTLSLSPLFAADIKIASTLLRTSLDSIDNLNSYRTFMNISFENNPFSTSLFNKLTEKREVKFNYRGQFTKFTPKVEYNQVYSITENGINVI
ncbi:hypothetical protein FO519_009302 [Halicephalobus sp. NKZ332]|nr:hypothetical protein FO519_009302 [Halicephalobus sp. NKZ332]